jgi:hypothetical protein
MIQNFEGDLLLDTRITFGGVAGCGLFGRPADAWKEIMQHEFNLKHIFRWVDNNLFVRLIGAKKSMKQVVARSMELGVKTNNKKYSEFLASQKFIGFLWDGVKKTVTLPEKKKEERLNQLEPFLQQDTTFNYHDAQVLAGWLNHVTYLLPQLRCYLQGLYQWQKEWCNHSTKREVPSDVVSNLIEWKKKLERFGTTRLIPDPDPKDIGWVGDASTSFGIGVIIGKKWAQLELIVKPSEDHNGNVIAWLKTVAIQIGLIILLKIGAIRGKKFTVWTDNSMTLSVIKARKSRNHEVNEEWKRIQALLMEAEIDLHPERVTSAKNRADSLSRGEQEGHLAKKRLLITLAKDLEGYLVQC